jgi:hypothetical protein
MSTRRLEPPLHPRVDRLSFVAEVPKCQTVVDVETTFRRVASQFV